MAVLVNRKAKRATKRGKRSTAAPRAAKSPSPGLLGQALRQLGSYGGAAVGGLLGNPAAGATVGNSLGASISRWLGAGDYSVGTNSIVAKTLKGTDTIPMMHRDGQSIVVRHKEYLGEITGSTSFTIVNSYELNPGNSAAFPWLSGVSAHFQEYRFRGLVFHYVPSSGMAVSSTNAALGTVMMQTSYRSNDSPPTGKVEMLNEYFSSEAVPSEAFCHPVECDPKENPFNVQYVRTGAVPSGDSPLLYDLGLTHVAVSGQQAGTGVLGDLWVTYEVELKKPIYHSNVTAKVESYSARFGTGFSANDWFIGAPTVYGTLGVLCKGRSITLPKGSQGMWQIMIFWNFSPAFATAVSWDGITATTENCSGVELIPGRNAYTPQNISSVASGGINRTFLLHTVYVSDPGKIASITYGSPTFSGNWTGEYVGVTVTPRQLN